MGEWSIVAFSVEKARGYPHVQTTLRSIALTGVKSRASASDRTGAADGGRGRFYRSAVPEACRSDFPLAAELSRTDRQPGPRGLHDFARWLDSRRQSSLRENSGCLVSGSAPPPPG